jgi:hypothetical protein
MEGLGEFFLCQLEQSKSNSDLLIKFKNNIATKDYNQFCNVDNHYFELVFFNN